MTIFLVLSALVKIQNRCQSWCMTEKKLVFACLGSFKIRTYFSANRNENELNWTVFYYVQKKKQIG